MGLSEAGGRRQVRGPRGKVQRSAGVGGTETKPRLVTSQPRPHQQPRNTDKESHHPQDTDTETTRAPGAAEARRSGALHRERWVRGQGSETGERERARQKRRQDGPAGLSGPRQRVRLLLPLVGKLRRETGAEREPAPRPPAPLPSLLPPPPEELQSRLWRPPCSQGPAEGHTSAHQAWVSSLVKLRR